MDVTNKQQVVIEFLLLEGRARGEIVIRLRNVYRSAVYCRASVFRWISEVRRGNEELRNEGRPGRPDRDKSDAAIRSIPQGGPNTLLRAITETLSISPEPVRMHMWRICYTLTITRWIPHVMICELKSVRFTMCLESFPKLWAEAHDD
jgi:hypothetical protein